MWSFAAPRFSLQPSALKFAPPYEYRDLSDSLVTL